VINSFERWSSSLTWKINYVLVVLALPLKDFQIYGINVELQLLVFLMGMHEIFLFFYLLLLMMIFYEKLAIPYMEPSPTLRKRGGVFTHFSTLLPLGLKLYRACYIFIALPNLKLSCRSQSSGHSNRRSNSGHSSYYSAIRCSRSTIANGPFILQGHVK
jgi:hypothetical protein